MRVATEKLPDGDTFPHRQTAHQLLQSSDADHK